MNPVETYISEMREIRSYGVAVEETSFYGTLETLLNEIGKTLKPKVRCIINIKNAGSGIPDGGLFTPDQKDTDMIGGQIPSRGVVEVKGIREDLEGIIQSDQVKKYLARYGQVLVTNYWGFALVGKGPGGKAVRLESFRLADDEADFRAKLMHPRKLADETGPQFEEFLRRVMLRAAELADPKDVAWLLASYARDARFRVENADVPALDAVRTALEEALGLEFKDEKGEHFFRSTLVQTIFYGIFSAWVLWSKENRGNGAAFDWQKAQYELHVPMISALFSQITMSDRLRPLGLVDILDSASSALNRVDADIFFQRFEEQHAVQYFYEPFLEAFDPDLRKELGVWYTPPEIVKYMVARVDTVLREELGIPDGLADPQVYVLDPACGTGAYLVEVLNHIHQTLEKKGLGAMVGADVKKAATERVFGFEILPAPFVVSHLQLGLLLRNMGAPLADDKERAGVYLTNSLTGWEPPTEEAKGRIAQLAMSFPELKQERDAAQNIKHHDKIIVVLGNPPYNAFAGVATTPEEQKLVEPYKEGLISKWGIRKFNLDDLYVRFFRMAERRIAEMTGRGIVCYISNFSYLRDPSFVVMRERFLQEFDALWFDCMNGDSRETGKLTPEGKPDPSVFSTEYNREGIRVGTAIGLMVRRTARMEKPTVRFRQFWGVAKRQELVESLGSQAAYPYEEAAPTPDNRFSFRPSAIPADYGSWPLLTGLAAKLPLQGMDEDRANALITFDRDVLAVRMKAYLDSTVTWDEFASLQTGLSRSSAGFDPAKVREKALREDKFDASKLRRYLFRPSDLRWCYYTGVPGVWKRSRPELWSQSWEGNTFIISRPAGIAKPEGVPIMYATGLFARDSMRGHAVAFPVRLRSAISERKGQGVLFGAEEAVGNAPQANLSSASCRYLCALELLQTEGDTDVRTAELIWMHVLAIGYAPEYLVENCDGIRDNWPRIPLPDTKDVLLASAELGRKLAALLDTENPVPGVTSGDIRPELRTIAVPSRDGGGNLNPDTDLAVTAGWGHAGKDGVTMPGKGRLVRRPVDSRQAAGATLGDSTFDIYLNDKAYWQNVPERVWEYTIGGYQVMKKWLSYRERDLLGRPLKPDEVKEVTDMARRIAAIVLLEPELDANYERVKAATYQWPGKQ